MNSIQGQNTLWNIDFSNPNSVATINNEAAELPVEESVDFSARGLGFMSYVYASMDTATDGVHSGDSSYVVENPDFLTKYSEDDIKNYLENNGASFNTTIDWAEYEDILSEDQITHLSSKYEGELTITQFCEAMDAIEALKELADVTGENESEEVDSYKLFASQMAAALDSYSNGAVNLTDDEYSDALSFLSADIYSSADTFSFADHFEKMIDDLSMNTNMDITNLLSVLEDLREQEANFSFNDVLNQLNPDTISGLVDFTNSISQ